MNIDDADRTLAAAAALRDGLAADGRRMDAGTLTVLMEYLQDAVTNAIDARAAGARDVTPPRAAEGGGGIPAPGKARRGRPRKVPRVAGGESDAAVSVSVAPSPLLAGGTTSEASDVPASVADVPVPGAVPAQVVP
jgi:hypothetical protein